MHFARLPALSSGRIGKEAWLNIGPVSTPVSMRMIVTPLSRSPFSIAACTGAAPRQRGSNEPWMLMHPGPRQVEHGWAQDLPEGRYHDGLQHHA